MYIMCMRASNLCTMSCIRVLVSTLVCVSLQSFSYYYKVIMMLPTTIAELIIIPLPPAPVLVVLQVIWERSSELAILVDQLKNVMFKFHYGEGYR